MIHYLDGEYHAGPLALDPAGPGFRSGCGLFETLFYNGRLVCHLERHVERLYAGLKVLGLGFRARDFGPIAARLLEANGLVGRAARLNIFCFLDSETGPVRTLAMAAPYDPDPDRTFRLMVWPERHESWLCGHKTMNRLHFFLARRQARESGFDDALVLDGRGRILETTTASLIFQRDGRFLEPAPGPRLPGIAAAVAGTLLDVRAEPLGLDEAAACSHAYVLNSLIGMRPVRALGGLEFAVDERTCGLVSKELLLTGP
ncbi:MAG: aminotransferase class IV [Desulfovibrionaceae bacterium]|nr:aminotransferase class IV [Desulfovibrionaceae bacterium]